MSTKPLQPFWDKSQAYYKNPNGRGWRIAATVFGIFVVLYGAADISSRLAHAAFGNNASLAAFAPVALVQNNAQQNEIMPATATSTSTPLIPSRLIIPSIGVNANVEKTAQKTDGSVGTPTTFGDVAWYDVGSEPGAAGNAVIDGHVNNALTTAGVFQHLSQIALGDKIMVQNAQGNSLTFEVTSIQKYPADTAPAATIFATTGEPQLVLITCDGTWVPSAKSFDQRLVVFAKLQ